MPVQFLISPSLGIDLLQDGGNLLRCMFLVRTNVQ